MNREAAPAIPFRYTACGLEGMDRFLQRLFEILPGATSGTILIGLIVLSYASPLTAIACIIAIDLLWLFYMIYTLLLVLATIWRLRIERGTDWMERVRGLDRLADYVEELKTRTPAESRARRFSHRYHLKDLQLLLFRDTPLPPSGSVHHVVIFSIFREGRQTVEAGLESLLAQDFPMNRVVVIFAVEENASRAVKTAAWELHREYFDRFLAFYVAPHSAGDGGNGPVKGAAVNYGARMAAEALSQRGVDLSLVMVSCLDGDAVLDSSYLACLTYHFLICPRRERACFQPVPVYHNNIWDAPGFASILHIGSSFFLMAEATNREELVTLASHSMTLHALIDVDFWPEDLLSDDQSVFWKAYLHYEGDYRVVPIPATLSLNVAHAGTFRETLRDVYRRKQRQAWGIKNLPILLRGFRRSRAISLSAKLRHALKMFQKHVASATWIFVLLIIGWLPGLIAQSGPVDHSIRYFAPRIHGVIFSLAVLGLAVAAVLSVLHLPKRKAGHSNRRLAGHVLAWIFLPLMALTMGALPALDVQARLLLGKVRGNAPPA